MATGTDSALAALEEIAADLLARCVEHPAVVSYANTVVEVASDTPTVCEHLAKYSAPTCTS